MTGKWKDFLTITSLSTTAISGGAAWTVFLVYMTHKIPYVGMPIATLFGAVGAFETVWIGKACGLAYQDWYKKYR